MGVKTLEGSLNAAGLRFALVLPRFNEVFGRRLLGAALDCLQRHGARESDLMVARVPGCFELPAAVAGLQAKGGVDAVIALGVLIRGATSHYEHVAAEAARGLGDCARRGGCPVTYGVVTAENQEEALERCGGKIGNRGWDAALAAIEMARLSGLISDGEGFSTASHS
ncbi:MAG: 6,7-dimethyl-8-ribityllumazine synthase [Acidobacteria bacterium]|nr:6,7-dimethyl-8-ribityllumazine synthase [Acidobacteriota bacterium]